MLSRSAERVYWSGRYLERAENTARIVQQYSQLFLDLPPDAGVDWNDLVRIFGADSDFGGESESDILYFLLADPNSFNSLAYSVRMARENVRNTRDLLPQESWESVNEFYRFASERLSLAASGENRFEVLADCIARCQQLNGVLIGTMSHRNPYHFLKLGQSIERADMTTRIIDVAAAYMQQNETLLQRYGSTLWTNVLKSVSGFQMYRQYRQPQVAGEQVVGFLLDDDAFPRSMRFCLSHAAKSASALPRGDSTIRALSDAAAALDGAHLDHRDAQAVSAFMDGMQKRLAAVHGAVVATWFTPEENA